MKRYKDKCLRSNRKVGLAFGKYKAEKACLRISPHEYWKKKMEFNMQDKTISWDFYQETKEPWSHTCTLATTSKMSRFQRQYGGNDW